MNKSIIRPTFYVLLFFLLFFSVTPSVYAASRQSIYLGRATTIKGDNFPNSKTLKLNYKVCNLVKGKTIKLKVLNLPTNHRVIFSSSNTKVVTVTKSGGMKGIKNGNATITATIKSGTRTVRRLTCSVEVGPAAFSVIIPRSSLSLSVNDQKYLSVIIKPSNAAEKATFKSSNSKVVTVTKDGLVKAIAPGEATITASIGNKKYDTCKIRVNKK